MEIKIRGFADALANLNGTLERLSKELPPAYEDAIEQMVKKTQAAAVAKLGKPKWLLSKAIGSKVKIYRDGKVVFGVTEALGKRNPAKNTPAFYAWYQEHGYHIGTDRIKRPNKRKYVRKHGAVTGYRVQKGKKFFTNAYKKYEKEFRELIDKINFEVLYGKNK